MLTFKMIPQQNKKDDIEVGVSYKGIFVYQDGEPLDSYGW